MDDAGGSTAAAETLIEQQEDGVLFLYRLTKVLLRSGYATNALRLTLVTRMTQCVSARDAVWPGYAAVAGFAGSLAKECPQWDLRVLDLERPSLVSAQECLALPWDKGGNVVAHRGGEWFEQGLCATEALRPGTSIYRRGGVYVAIGGAGGLGEVWTRFMVERHQAQVVWIGRRPHDRGIAEKVERLSRLGRAPLYISADATDLTALQRAHDEIVRAHGAIHGVVHSAIVLRDRSLVRMDEADFKAALSAKVDVSVNMSRVFGGHALDFMVFFSSAASFFKSPGQSNYAAGCTFKDSFARSLQQRCAYPVKTVNWGYWGNVGIVADEPHRTAMQAIGIGSIEPREGMAALEALVGSDVPQAAVIKTLGGQAPEGLRALDLELLEEQLTALLAGRRVRLPHRVPRAPR